MANRNAPLNKIESDTCSEPDCDQLRKPASNGRGRHRQCHDHLRAANKKRWRTYQRPQRPWRRKLPLLDLNAPISYVGAHDRVVYWRGPASRYPCSGCGVPAEEWAYGGGSRHERRGAGSGSGARSKDLRYSSDPMAYVPMCVKCHRKHDKAARDARLA